MSSEYFVGVDVSKASLDVAIMPDGDVWQVGNDEVGIRQLVRRLGQLGTGCVVLEATGGYERAAARALFKAGLPVAIVNPRHPRAYARATGRLAKTDRIDAQVLSRFGEIVRPRLVTSDDAAREELSGLEARRLQLVEMVTAEENRLETAQPGVARGIRQHLGWLRKEVKRLDKEIEQRMHSRPEWSMTAEILRSVPGVGPVLSAAIIAGLPELGRADRHCRVCRGHRNCRHRSRGQGSRTGNSGKGCSNGGRAGSDGRRGPAGVDRGCSGIRRTPGRECRQVLGDAVGEEPGGPELLGGTDDADGIGRCHRNGDRHRHRHGCPTGNVPKHRLDRGLAKGNRSGQASGLVDRRHAPHVHVRVDDRQQQRNGRGGAQSGQHADRSAQDTAQKGEQQVRGGKGNLKA